VEVFLIEMNFLLKSGPVGFYFPVDQCCEKKIRNFVSWK